MVGYIKNSVHYVKVINISPHLAYITYRPIAYLILLAYLTPFIFKVVSENR